MSKCKVHKESEAVHLNMCESCIEGLIEGLNSDIEELEVELDKHQWISTNDRLPEEGTGVLACDANYGDIGECRMCSFGRGAFWYEGVNFTFRITHWKPIIMPESEAK